MTVSHVALQSIWALLVENGMSVKSLVAALSFFVLAGKAKAANVRQRVSSLHAASLYLLLLGIPGKNVLGNLGNIHRGKSAHCFSQMSQMFKYC